MTITKRSIFNPIPHVSHRGCAIAALLLFAAALCITGCGGVSTGTSSAAAGRVPSLQGTIHGGQQPIGYANVQIWQVGATGYGSGATALIPGGSYFAGGASGCVAAGSQVCYPGVVSTAAGTFNITGDYSCTPGAELYITGTAGQSTPGSNNSAIALMLGFGPCGASNGSATSLVIDEVTTVASVYALAAFMPSTPASVPTAIGSSASNQTGLVNAFGDIQTLVNPSTGNANLSTANVTLPSAELNALSNTLAACINSLSATSTTCAALFGATLNADGSTPSDTIGAALNIARNPGRNVATLLAMQSAVSPFQPTIVSASDLTLAATYTGNGISVPTGVAMDGAGNVWIANAGTSAASSSVTELSHTGAALSGASGYTAGSLNLPSAIAIDGSGNAWIANAGSNTLSELSASGARVGGPYSGGLVAPSAIAIDGLGYVWVADAGDSSVSKFAANGTVLSGAGFTGNGLSKPTGIAINFHP